MTVDGELSTLRDLHTTLKNSAEDITRIASDITSSLDNAGWTGEGDRI